MDIIEALTAAIKADTATADWLDKKVSQLPKMDVVVQRGMLESALAEIQHWQGFAQHDPNCKFVKLRLSMPGKPKIGDEFCDCGLVRKL